MVEIIPAILTESEEELVRLVHMLERSGVTRAHLDICDGDFVPTRTINGYDQLPRLSSTIRWDVHLMVRHPEQYIDHWWRCGCVGRFIAHVEATDMMPTLVDHCHGHGQELWAAINPDTPLEKLKSAPGADGAVFLTVMPGEQGGAFQSRVLEAIGALHANHPALPIMADGGITLETAPLCVAAGASALVSGSYVIRSPDMRRAIEALRAAV